MVYLSSERGIERKSAKGLTVPILIFKVKNPEAIFRFRVKRSAKSIGTSFIYMPWCQQGATTESRYYSRSSRMDIMYVKEVYLEEKAFARARMAGSLLLHVKEHALRTGKAESCCFA